MADLIEEGRRIILDNPLVHSLDSVREALRRAERDTQGEAFGAERSSLSFNAASFCLFSVLFNSAVLPSLNSKKYLPSRMMWHAFANGPRSAISRTNSFVTFHGSYSIRATLRGPPTYHPLSWLPFNHTAIKAEAEVFEEICHFTVPSGGFTGNILKSTNGTAEPPKYAREPRMSTSIARRSGCTFHSSLLKTTFAAVGLVCRTISWRRATEQAAYSERFRQDEDGSDSQHYGSDYEYSQELELLVKKRKTGSAVDKHDWGDILAIGRLAQSEQTEAKELLLQLGSAVREVFAQQPSRRFLLALTLTDKTMETWVFDRSGPYSGATCSAGTYLMVGDEELGLDTFTEEKDGRQFVTIPVNPCATAPIQLELNPKPISCRRAIISRATACFAAKPIGAPEFDRVIKYYWIPSTWTSEADLLSMANKHHVQCVTKLVDHERKSRA
ncbi:hypothetical protein E4U16_003396 [Claviceps sp. LM84 group G4]|nr:hypothetical protein E4U16_003396 [Claviceps sp. LM84 group G4]